MSAGKDAEEDKGLWYLQHTSAKKGMDAAAREILARDHCAVFIGTLKHSALYRKTYVISLQTSS